MEKKRDVKVTGNRMREANYVRNYWVVTVEQGTTREDLKDPAFWSHVSTQFSPYDRIEVRIDDGVFFAEYLILSCDRTWAKVKELNFVSLTTHDVSITEAEKLEEFAYKWRGPHGGHSIIRLKDNEIMTEKKSTREEAEGWLREYKKTIA